MNQAFGVMPVGGDAIAVEQARLTEHKGPGADGAVARSPLRRRAQPGVQPRMLIVIGPRPARYQQHVIGRPCLVDMDIGLHHHAVGRPQCPALGSQG
ncbi:hypothetical protein D3C84_1137960 [compost metagenome]